MDVIDHMPEHERYQQAIQGIVKTYLLLADRKVEADAKKAEADAEAARVAATTKPLTAKQRKAKKNAERRARREAQKLEEEAAAAAAAAGGSAAAAPAAATGDKDESKLEDEAAKLEAVEQPLEEAAKCVPCHTRAARRCCLVLRAHDAALCLCNVPRISPFPRCAAITAQVRPQAG